jgi:hypothetical protein
MEQAGKQLMMKGEVERSEVEQKIGLDSGSF